MNSGRGLIAEDLARELSEVLYREVGVRDLGMGVAGLDLEVAEVDTGVVGTDLGVRDADSGVSQLELGVRDLGLEPIFLESGVSHPDLACLGAGVRDLGTGVADLETGVRDREVLSAVSWTGVEAGDLGDKLGDLYLEMREVDVAMGDLVEVDKRELARVDSILALGDGDLIPGDGDVVLGDFATLTDLELVCGEVRGSDKVGDLDATVRDLRDNLGDLERSVGV